MHLTTTNGKALEKMISVQKNEQKEVLSLDGIDGMTTEAIRK
jgi:hypothetical protein